MSTNWVDISSTLCGIIYSMCWNLSFYPQLYELYRLKSVAGFSLEFALLNPSGYFFYTIYTTTGFIDPTLGSGHVDWADLFFACHGLFMSTAQLVECIVFPRTKNNQGFKLWVVLFLACEYIVFTVFLVLQLSGHSMPAGGSVINICGYCKAAITLVKYTP